MLKATGTETGYQVTYRGCDFQINRSGRKWVLLKDGDEFISEHKKVKECKEAIKQYFQDDKKVVKPAEKDDQLWNHFPPAAAIALLLDEIGRPPTEIEKNILDCLGFLNEDGSTDLEQAKRLKKNFQ